MLDLRHLASRPSDRALLAATRSELLALGIDEVGLRNETGLMQTLASYMLDMALADGDTRSEDARMDRHGSPPHVGAVTVG